MPDLEKYGEVELTSKERSSMARLSENKDFHALMDVMLRWQLKRAYDLQATPHSGQDAELLQNQGGFSLFRRMLKYVSESIDTTHHIHG